jgi:hypothetical protein
MYEINLTYVKSNLKCLAVGAQLFYPTDKSEEEAVFATIVPKSVKKITLGIHNTFIKGYKSVDG